MPPCASCSSSTVRISSAWQRAAGLCATRRSPGLTKRMNSARSSSDWYQTLGGIGRRSSRCRSVGCHVRLPLDLANCGVPLATLASRDRPWRCRHGSRCTRPRTPSRVHRRACRAVAGQAAGALLVGVGLRLAAAVRSPCLTRPAPAPAAARVSRRASGIAARPASIANVTADSANAGELQDSTNGSWSSPPVNSTASSVRQRHDHERRIEHLPVKHLLESLPGDEHREARRDRPRCRSAGRY